MEQVIIKKILIVDDDEDFRQALSIKLKKQGYIILESEDGITGLERLKSESPDMVMVDVQMPGMNGFEFCEQAAKLNSKKNIPIMIMTAQDDQDSVNKAYESGATDFITKPINYAKLNHRIRFSLRASETAEKLASRERQLMSAQKAAKMGEWVFEIKKNKFYFSDEVANIFDINKQQITSYDDLMKYVVDEDIYRVRDVFAKLTEKNADYSLEYTIKTGNGKIKRIRQINDVTINNPESKDRVLGIFQDITDIRNAEKKLKTLSLYDSLTGLPNRQFFKRLLAKTVASSKRHERHFAILDINLDKFMRINTNLGHDVGDRLLIDASQRLKQTIRDSDVLYSDQDEKTFSSGVLAHLGGDDFIILLNDIKSTDDAAKVARRINNVFGESFVVDENEVHMTVSIGIGIYPDDGGNADDLLKKTSTALNNAKETGRNCYRFYTEAMNTLSFQRLSLEISLRKAIEQEQFLLYYQPKISLDNKRITGAEALIRWNHPDMGLVSPADFIPVAEDTGLIVPMTDWIIAEACRQLSAWRKDGLNLESIAINISPASLLDKNINEHVFKHLRLAGVEASHLDFEITESVLMEDVDVILPILHEFRNIGTSISIDDFGTGYSSLSYLKRLPISKLKIDQSFIRDLMHDKDDSIIVNAVIALAHNLGFSVIAEGVEEQDQLEYLKKHGCDVVQGYYYTRPLPADEYHQWSVQYESGLLGTETVIMAG
jgi:diguanylate cyclase (GGDEF)-like protein